MMGGDDRPITTLRNIGPKSAGWLDQEGVATIGDLRRIGAVGAYARIRATRPEGVSLNLLWALAAGLLDMHWSHLPGEIKAHLLGELERLDDRSGDPG